ncbi:hypothetical protein TREMEDRAFT_65117 [Tremella mesenterica DSM 1558]|uniref:uncharacterized protein n=1 Tax=Tremella mesenterica (strain ATCC 24925 / CBS 8224 / DSM 1558 / NBRC 9311 / NRRL Y-6157 / RJB 2259-6 / UBC 559-6) TaxID=578456 RepID=UPI00032D1F0E|nr:uncharacterized protein TREMEDRAFT_65117 [Tremella mesenterica DSM 1558]EIW66723.1 hypothetical protein TREMEDRAFT_65117 [Tremella mesenterica DSM 1558]
MSSQEHHLSTTTKENVGLSQEVIKRSSQVHHLVPLSPRRIPADNKNAVPITARELNQMKEPFQPDAVRPSLETVGALWLAVSGLPASLPESVHTVNRRSVSSSIVHPIPKDVPKPSRGLEIPQENDGGHTPNDGGNLKNIEGKMKGEMDFLSALKIDPPTTDVVFGSDHLEEQVVASSPRFKLPAEKPHLTIKNDKTKSLANHLGLGWVIDRSGRTKTGAPSSPTRPSASLLPRFLKAPFTWGDAESEVFDPTGQREKPDGVEGLLVELEEPDAKPKKLLPRDEDGIYSSVFGDQLAATGQWDVVREDAQRRVVNVDGHEGREVAHDWQDSGKKLIPREEKGIYSSILHPHGSLEHSFP